MQTENQTHQNRSYDIIADIHGYADTLRVLLERLGYVERDGIYRNPERIAIFVGDFIDRGPKIREALQIVKGTSGNCKSANKSLRKAEKS